MLRSRPVGTALAMLLLVLSILALAGCGLFSRRQEAPAEAPQPALSSSPAPTPPPLRQAGAQIADEESLKGLVQGRTTKAEVQDRFGVPQEVILSPGVETFIYYRDRSSGWFSRTTERVEMLTVRFDVNGVVKDFEYRYSGKK